MRKGIVVYGLALLIGGIITAVVDVYGIIIPITLFTYMNEASFMWAVEAAIAATLIFAGCILMSWGAKKGPS